ncbi:4-hydroxy-tetrahydrodipicolinate reductase [Planctomycetota bacterium]
MKSQLVIVGAGGRMGRQLVSLGAEHEALQVVGAVDHAEHPELGQEVCGAGVILNADFPARAQVVIDFSLPEATDRTLTFCREQQASLVLGTTGLSKLQQQALQALAGEVPVVYASNMSVGMNVLFALVGKAAAMLGEAYDIEIVEQHHRFKKDAPSGSAMTLAENICSATDRPFPEALTHGRSGNDALRENGKIGMHAVRAGDIVGVHTVQYSTLGETMTLNHTAHSRDTFVHGALRAAAWVVQQKPGLYNMRDVLGLD